MCAVGCLAWHVVHIIKPMAVVFGLPALAELVNWCLQAKPFPTAGGFSRSNGEEEFVIRSTVSIIVSTHKFWISICLIVCRRPSAPLLLFLLLLGVKFHAAQAMWWDEPAWLIFSFS